MRGTDLIVTIPFVLGAYSFVAFDRLVWLQAKRFPDAWRNDGCPAGFFMSPSSWEILAASQSARNRAMFRWIFRPPQWARHSPETARWLAHYRAATFLSWLAIPAAFAGFVLERP